MMLMIDFKRVLDLYDPESSVFIFSEYQIQMNNLFFSNVCRDKCELCLRLRHPGVIVSPGLQR